MSIVISITDISASTPNPPGLFTLRRYGDPRMVELMGLDTAFLGTGNFQNIVFYTPAGRWGAINQYQRMDAQALAYLESIQPLDDVDVQRKLNWLGIGSDKGRPYMLKNGVNCWGTMGFGGQRIRVAVDGNGQPLVTKFIDHFQQVEKTQEIEFFTVVGLRRSDIGRSVKELYAEGLIQKATEAFYQPPNFYNDHPQGGVIYNPVWSPLDWPSNNGSTLYLAKLFCEEF